MKQLLKTKHAGKKLAAVLIAFTLFLPSLTAQVTIGSNLEPNEGSLLQLKEIESVDVNNVETGLANSGKGLNLPRVALSHEYKLFPMFQDFPTENYTAEFIQDSIALKMKHRGLMVYSVKSLNSDDRSQVGIYTWNGEKWEYTDSAGPWYDVKTQTSAINNTDEVYLNATATIGKAIGKEDREYAHGALLQLIEESEGGQSRDANLNSNNAYHGFALPRVGLTHKNELYPMFLPKPGLSADDSRNATKEHDYDNPEKPEVKDALKASHRGLMVYNATDNDDFSPGIYTWDGTQWEKAISDASMPNLLKSIDIPIGVDITTQTIAFYGQVGYVPEDAENEDDVDPNAPEDAYYIMTLEPLMVDGDINFTPNNLFFSTSVRPAKVDEFSTIESGNSYWKIKIENRNISVDPGKHALMRSIRIYYYTPRGGSLWAIKDGEGKSVTAIQFEGLDADPNQ